MTDSHDWLDRYAAAHRQVTWAPVYWAAVQLVVLGTVGLLWLVPVPAEFESISPLMNWGSAFLMAAAVYYFILSVPLAIGMLPFLLGVAWFQVWLGDSVFSAPRVASGFLLGGLIGLWLGHRNQRGVRPVLEDLQMMMIAPAWLLSILYRRIGIPI
ncbi:MAG: hypothetical protein R3176_05600 [Woeseiaceae bacterium]|nr:hypothetical protein [Woeseiaceae bacterium]